MFRFVIYLLMIGLSATDYTFTLYQNPVGSLGTTNLDQLNASLSTVFITHGWLRGSKVPWVVAMTNAYLSTLPVNVVIFDWTPYSSTRNYFKAAAAVKPAGKKLGEMIKTLFTNQRINISTTHLVGFSLGAHVIGVAGETFTAATNTTLEVLVGLDAPGIAFYTDNGRLSKTDGKFVQAFHTSTFGRLKPYAHVDVFFNTNGMFWGVTQPNCPSNPGAHVQPHINFVACGHIRSVVYWTESVFKNQFLAVPCQRFGHATGIPIGYGMSTAVRGKLCLKTNGVSPFGRGLGGVV